VDPEWLRQAASTSKWCCGRGCGAVRPSFYPNPVHIPVKRRPRSSIEPAPAALIIARGLLEVLRPYMPPVIMGSCKLAGTGEVLESHATVYTPVESTLFLRGGHGCEYRVCQWCGYPELQSDGTDSQPEYIAREQLGPYLAYQLGSHGSPVIAPRLRDSIAWSEYPDVSCYEYPVIDDPIDGIVFPPLGRSP